MTDKTASIASEESPSQIYGFINSFPAWMQNTVCALANGQVLAEEAFDAYERVHEDSLKGGQHPIFAVSSGSHPAGHEKFFVGEALVGQTLVLRTPGAAWLDTKGEMTPTAKAFLALVGSKHIAQLVHVKSSASELVKLAYDYNKHGEEKTDGLPKVLSEFASGRASLYNEVAKKDLNRYRSVGVNLVGTREEQTLQAMAVEQALQDYREALKVKGAPEVVLVFQNEKEGRHYVWSEKREKFVMVPTNDHAPAVNREEAVAFLKELPEAEAWEQIGYILIAGATEFRKAKKESIGKSFEEAADASCCSDSRTPPKILLGRSASRQRYVLRTPGAFLSKDGKLSYEAELYLALAAQRGRVVVHSHHGNCGAMGAVGQYCADPSGKGKELPPAFQDMGEFRQELYNKVYCQDYSKAKGNTLEEKIVHHYREKTGVNVLCSGDCLGLQQLLWDYEAAHKNPDSPPIVAVYQNVPEGRTYVLHPKDGKFKAIPTFATLDPKPEKAGQMKPFGAGLMAHKL